MFMEFGKGVLPLSFLDAPLTHIRGRLRNHPMENDPRIVSSICEAPFPKIVMPARSCPPPHEGKDRPEGAVSLGMASSSVLENR